MYVGWSVTNARLSLRKCQMEHLGEKRCGLRWNEQLVFLGSQHGGQYVCHCHKVDRAQHCSRLLSVLQRQACLPQDVPFQGTSKF